MRTAAIVVILSAAKNLSPLFRAAAAIWLLIAASLALATLDTSVPAAPGALQISTHAAPVHEAVISWTPNPPGSSQLYDIERNGLKLNENPIVCPHYLDISVQPGAVYTYDVRQWTPTADSAPSASKTVTIPSP